MSQPRNHPIPRVTLRQTVSDFIAGQHNPWPEGVRVIDLSDEEGSDVAYMPIADLSRYLNERSDWHGIGRHG